MRFGLPISTINDSDPYEGGDLMVGNILFYFSSKTAPFYLIKICKRITMKTQFFNKDEKTKKICPFDL